MKYRIQFHYLLNGQQYGFYVTASSIKTCWDAAYEVYMNLNVDKNSLKVKEIEVFEDE